MRAAATHQIRYYEVETIIPFTGINITNLKSNPSSVSLESVWRRWRVNYSHTTIIVVEASIGASPPHPHANKTTAHHPDTASKLGAQNHWHFITLFSSFSDARENIIVIISIFHKFVSCCCCCRWFFFSFVELIIGMASMRIYLFSFVIWLCELHNALSARASWMISTLEIYDSEWIFE